MYTFFFLILIYPAKKSTVHGVDQVTPTDGVKENAADSSTCKAGIICRLWLQNYLLVYTPASGLYSGFVYWLHYCSYHYCDCFSWPGPSLIVAVIVITSFLYKCKLLCNPRHVAIQAHGSYSSCKGSMVPCS